MARITKPKSKTLKEQVMIFLTNIYHVRNTGMPDTSGGKESKVAQEDRQHNPIINPITKRQVMRYPDKMEEVTVDGETFKRRVYSANFQVQYDATGFDDGTYDVPAELSIDQVKAIVNARTANESITKTIPNVKYILNDNHEVYTRDVVDEHSGEILRTLVFANYCPERTIVRTSLNLADIGK